MTILNTTSDGLPHVYDLVYRTLYKEKRVQFSKLKDRLCPASECKSAPLKNVLKTWKKLGVFKETDDEIWSLVNPSEPEPRKAAISSLADKNHNHDFWGTEFGSDYIRALCWMLLQDADGMILTTSRLEQLEESQYEGSDEILQNATRINGFKFWANYLGFAQASLGDDQIQPGKAIGLYLKEIFCDSNRLNIKTFLTRLDEVLPVFDESKYRQEVKSKLRYRTVHEPQSGQLSVALSRGLLFLKGVGELNFPTPDADASKYEVLYHSDQVALNISHIEWTKF